MMYEKVSRVFVLESCEKICSGGYKGGGDPVLLKVCSNAMAG